VFFAINIQTIQRVFSCIVFQHVRMNIFTICSMQPMAIELQ